MYLSNKVYTTIKYNNKGNIPPKRPNRFWVFIKKLLSKILTKKYLYSAIIIFSTGFIIRVIINNLLGVDVFK